MGSPSSYERLCHQANPVRKASIGFHDVVKRDLIAIWIMQGFEKRVQRGREKEWDRHVRVEWHVLVHWWYVRSARSPPLHVLLYRGGYASHKGGVFGLQRADDSIRVVSGTIGFARIRVFPTANKYGCIFISQRERIMSQFDSQPHKRLSKLVTTFMVRSPSPKRVQVRSLIRKH